MNKSVNVKITNELKIPTTPGRYYRFLCMTGSNKGRVYYLIGKRIIIGRGEDADIIIVDIKISRNHAELSFSNNGYTITDLGAENGIIVNDSKVKQKKLADSEKIVIGKTVFKYNIIEVSSAENAVLDQENANDVSKDVNVLRLKNQLKAKKSDWDSNSVSESNEDLSDKKGGPKVLIMGIVIVVVLYILMEKDESVRVVKNKNSNAITDFEIAAIIPRKISQEDSETKKKLESFIHSGRREFSEGNYFRAIEDFRLALLLSPNNGHASFYLSKAKQRMDEDIEKNFLKGKQEYESKKYQSSIVSYCGVVQLIQNYPNDERYKNAMLKISAIESELGLEKGEVKCFEEKSADSKN